MTLTEDFIRYLDVEQRCSRHTSEAYRRDLTQFAEWCCGIHSKDFSPETVTTNDIRAWIGTLADSGMSSTSLRRKLQSLRAFYRWGQRQKLFEKNPASDVVLTKKKKKLPDFVSPDDVESLLADGNCDFRSIRQHLILEMLYGLGLRQAELLSLTDADISHGSSEIRVTGKRNKQRVLPLPEKLAETIREWQTVRDEQYPELESPRPLIAGPHGALSKNQLYRIVHDSMKGVAASRKSPHTLRHSFATAMLNNGANLDSVRELLGHASLATTQIYTHLSINELLSNYHSGHPRARREKKNQ